MSLNISADLVPLGGGAWATHTDIYGKGGYRSVADNTARDAITTLRRSEGMLVYVIATGNRYRLGAGLTNADWVLESAGTILAGNGLTGTTTFAVLANGVSIEVAPAGIRRAALTGVISAAAGSNVTAFASGSFGALPISNTSSITVLSGAPVLQLGLAPLSGVGSAASQGDIRLRNNTGGAGTGPSCYARNAADNNDIYLWGYDSPTVGLQLGSPAGGLSLIDMRASTVQVRGTTSVIIGSGATTVRLDATSWKFNDTVAAPQIGQLPTATATGQKLTISAQQGVTTGGALDIAPGSGVTGGLGRLTNGAISAARFSWNDTGIGFYTTAPVAQPADMVALTDNSTGAATNAVADVGGAFNQAALNNIHASLIAKINALRTQQRTLGLMA